MKIPKFETDSGGVLLFSLRNTLLGLINLFSPQIPLIYFLDNFHKLRCWLRKLETPTNNKGYRGKSAELKLHLPFDCELKIVDPL